VSYAIKQELNIGLKTYSSKRHSQHYRESRENKQSAVKYIYIKHFYTSIRFVKEN